MVDDLGASIGLWGWAFLARQTRSIGSWLVDTITEAQVFTAAGQGKV
jgi:hypothetical protein